MHCVSVYVSLFLYGSQCIVLSSLVNSRHILKPKKGCGYLIKFFFFLCILVCTGERTEFFLFIFFKWIPLKKSTTAVAVLNSHRKQRWFTPTAESFFSSASNFNTGHRKSDSNQTLMHYKVQTTKWYKNECS